MGGEAVTTGDTMQGALCLNCGTRLVGEHCHACGQSAHVHRTIGAIGHELAHGVFHFEGKIWRTLPMLAFRPGELTRRYVAGERARFISPLALFLFSVFLMFAVMHATGAEIAELEANPIGRMERAGQILGDIGDRQARLRRIETEASAAPASRRPELNERSAELREEIARLRQLRRDVISGKSDGEGVVQIHMEKTGWARLDKGIEKAKKNPSLLLYKIQSTAYKYSWLLIPVSTPFLAMLFLWRRRFGLYDHAVFVTYSLSFMMAMAIVLTVAAAAGTTDDVLVPVATIIAPLHMYKQLRGAYSLSRRSALWRTAVLTIFAFAVLTVWFLLLVLRGLTA